MKIAIFGKTPERKNQLKKEIEKFGFTSTEKNPAIVISYGGDGTFLAAERAYPGIPKTLFRASNICKKCHNLPIDHALELLKNKKYRIESLPKLQAKNLLATNDLVIRNAEQTHALRFILYVNSKQIGTEFIGDGLVIATPFGSSGYFHSITRQQFSSGIGIAFNNTTIPFPPLLLKGNPTITFTLNRGTALLSADNNASLQKIHAGQTITITKSKQKAKIIKFSSRNA